MDKPARRRSWPLSWLIAAVVLLLVAALSVPVREDRGWVDAVSATRRSQTAWFGVGGPVTATPSALEVRWRAMGIQWEPDWRLVQGDRRSLVGVTLAREHGLAPPIYLFDWSMQKTFVDFSTDEQVREFFDVMSNDTPSEQAIAVAGAHSKVFGLLLEGAVAAPVP